MNIEENSHHQIYDFSQSLPQSTFECDVVIVGTGAGGGITAEILARSGLSVILVEEGPLKTAQDFKMQEKQAYADLYQEVAGRQTKDKGIQILQGRSVGGSTTVNWTSSFRTPKQTLDYWLSEFGLSNFTSESMQPWFQWVEQRLNITPWSVPPNKNNQLLADGAKKLGWKYAVIPRNVKGCANLGYCGMGCPINAKQSMLVTTIPTALDYQAALIHRTRVESLLVENNRVVGVNLSAMNRLGQVKKINVAKIRAKKIVLSAGAIGSPSVLLRSKTPDPYRQLGRRTMLHPVSACVAKMPEPVDAFSGAPQSIYSDEFLWRDGVTGDLGYKIEVPPMHPVLSSTLLMKHGNEHAKLMKDLNYYQANLALLRDGFHPDSVGGQVELDDDNYPLLDYPITKILWLGMQAAMRSMVELQFAAGAQSVLPLHLDAKRMLTWKSAKSAINNLSFDKKRWQTMSAHVMGGCSMGNDEKRSVVNQRGEHHQLENLVVIDGSLFPTSLGVNPQLTIYSIAARLAVDLVQSMNRSLPKDLLHSKNANLGQVTHV